MLKQADLDTPLKTADNLLEPETLNNVSAKKIYHMDFHVPSKLHTWAEEQWKTIDNHTSLNRGEVEKTSTCGIGLGYVLGDERMASRKMVFPY